MMREQRYGNVVLMGSDQVLHRQGISTVYGMSKAALGQLTKSTRDRLRAPQREGQLHLPGHYRHADARARRSSASIRSAACRSTAIHDMLKKAQPIQRLGTPEEIGKAVMFLLSDECPFMTGALISADGGYTCQ